MHYEKRNKKIFFKKMYKLRELYILTRIKVLFFRPHANIQWLWFFINARMRTCRKTKWAHSPNRAIKYWVCANLSNAFWLHSNLYVRFCVQYLVAIYLCGAMHSTIWIKLSICGLFIKNCGWIMAPMVGFFDEKESIDCVRIQKMLDEQIQCSAL